MAYGARTYENDWRNKIVANSLTTHPKMRAFLRNAVQLMTTSTTSSTSSTTTTTAP